MRNKIPITVTVIVIIIVSFSAILSGVHRGRESAVSAMSESVTVPDKTNPITVTDIMRGSNAVNILLPECYIHEKPLSVRTTTCRKYTETDIRLENGSITVRDYHYAYLVEDEPVKIDDAAVKISRENIDFFITDNKNGTCTLLYYKDAVKYTITERCAKEEMLSVCENIVTIL